MNKHLKKALLASTALGFFAVVPAHAADSTADAIKALQAQVDALQKQLVDLQTKEKARAEAPASAAPAPASTAEAGKKEILPGVTVKLGGYVAMEGIYRDHNQTADTSSSISSGIPYENARGSNQDEFRFSARSTRLSLLASGKVDDAMSLAAYFETDFMGAANTSNSLQTNSYTPRLRHAFASVDRNDWGLHFAAGQTWSMVSLSKSGMMPLKEAGYIGIDSTGTPGFVYTRSPQVRVVKDFANAKGQIGLSLETPQANVSGLPTGYDANYILRNAGSGGLNNDGTQYSMDYAPDVVAKVGYDTSVGRIEAFGLTRFFRDTVQSTNSYYDNYAMGLGGGVGAYVNVIPKKLEVQANFLGGKGVGRYSAGLMPDFALTPSGDIKPVTMLAGMFGIVGHPTPKWDLYVYAGAEKVMRQEYHNTAYGLGSALTDMTGCYQQGSGQTCNPQTEMVWQITPGFWTTVYKGDFGNIKLGGQYSFTRKDAFSGANDKQPHAYENVVMTSFRYSPF
jgi:hypothetical protein